MKQSANQLAKAHQAAGVQAQRHDEQSQRQGHHALPQHGGQQPQPAVMQGIIHHILHIVPPAPAPPPASPARPGVWRGSICFGIGYDYSRFPDKPQEETRDKMDELPGNIFLFSAKTYKAYRRHRYSRSRARRRVRETVERFSPSSPAIWGMVIPRS